MQDTLQVSHYITKDMVIAAALWYSPVYLTNRKYEEFSELYVVCFLSLSRATASTFTPVGGCL